MSDNEGSNGEEAIEKLVEAIASQLAEGTSPKQIVKQLVDAGLLTQNHKSATGHRGRTKHLSHSV